MADAPFVYVTYIKTTPERLWEALTRPEFTSRYWSGTRVESTWEPGADVRLVDAQGTPADTGKVLAYEPCRKLSYSWTVGHSEVFRREGSSRVTFELEPAGESVKLSVTHDQFPDASKVREAVSNGWPMLMCSLKSLLETDAPLDYGKSPEQARAEAIARAGG